MADASIAGRYIDRLNKLIGDRKLRLASMQEDLKAATLERAALNALKDPDPTVLAGAGLIEYDAVALQSESDQLLAEINALQNLIAATKASA